MQGSVGAAIFINAALFGVANRARALTLRGALITGLMGFWIYLTMGWRGYLIPILFLVLGSFFTRSGYEKKRRRHAAEKSEGVRGVREVLANGLVPLVLTVPILLVDAKLFTLGYVAAWATALCDTSATELGGLWGKRNYLIRNLRTVPPGTKGAVSVEGTVAGFLSAFFLVSVAYCLQLVSLRMVLPLSLAALLGSLLESYFAEIIPLTCRTRHELLNILNTSVGSSLALFWGALFTNTS